MSTTTTTRNTFSTQRPESWWWSRLLKSIGVPGFRFMVHDRWANVLFLHWRVPPHLEATLEENTAPFLVERFDGSSWIGLVLLTEENVGPSIGRTPWTCVTHHGINLRTYVRGVCDDDGVGGSGGGDRQPQRQRKRFTTRGIHFSSLECNDEFTALGANFFGMPYRVAQMMRSYWQGKDADEENNRRFYRVRSERLRFGEPSLVRVLSYVFQWLWQKTLETPQSTGRIGSTLEEVTTASSTTTSNGVKFTSGTEKGSLPEKPAPVPSSRDFGNGQQQGNDFSQRFTVDCTWSRGCSRRDDAEKSTTTAGAGDDAVDVFSDGVTPDETTRDNKSNDKPPFSLPRSSPSPLPSTPPPLCFSAWATERYFVYTHKYGTTWRGEVDHEPWPVETAPGAAAAAAALRIENLELSGIDAYEPKGMRPVLSYMSNNPPDHAGFSTGVGPVTFTMLQPV